MTVAVGCTGGKHRSVAMAEEIAARLRAAGRRRAAGAPRPGAGVTTGRARATPPTSGWSRSAAGTGWPRPWPRCAASSAT